MMTQMVLRAFFGLLLMGCSASSIPIELAAESKAATPLESVKIGDQIWTAKNLNTVTFRNGDTIPEAKTTADWIAYGKENKPAWCGYIFTDENALVYGKKYNWYAVNDPRGLAPEGWHVASYEEWLQLAKFVGGEKIAGGKLKSTNYWAEGSNGTDEFKLSLLPAGEVHVDGDTSSVGFLNSWWSSTPKNENLKWGEKPNQFAYQVVQYYFDNHLRVTNKYVNMKGGSSVRCVKD